MFLITHGFLSLRSRDGFDEQKEQLGFDKAVEECKYRMSRYGVTPNMLILPPQMLLYMALAPEAKLLYKEGGPAAEARFEGGVAGIEAKAFRGCGVFTSEPFEVSDDQDSVQMLTRSTQVGEFYIMQPPQINPGFGKTMFTADIMIYDEESDRHVRIEWDDAMNACRVDDLDNDIVLKNFPASTDGKVKSTWKAAAAEISKFNKGLKGDSTAIANETETADMFNTLQKECRIMVVRPFIEHLMHSAILAVSGRDTGATLFGPADMQLSANTQVKTIEGHYTYAITQLEPLGHFKAVITKPQNVLVMRDIACGGYVAGCNTRWFVKNETDGTYSLTSAKDNMMKRLSFADDVGSRYGSMLAFPCWGGQFESGALDTVCSITTRLLPWEVTSAMGGGGHSSFPGGDAAYNEYNKKLQLRAVHFGEDMKAAENQEFISQGSTNNATCFVGPHRRYDPFTRSFLSLIPGQGHFGPDAIPGDARWRRGESVSLKSARDAMVGLELAQHAQMVYTNK